MSATTARPPRRRPDILRRLYRGGSLSPEAWRAACEVRRIAERLETALLARPGTLGAPSQAARRRAPASAPIERLPPALRIAIRGHYRQWCDEMARIAVSRDPKLSLLSLTLAVTVHGASFAAMESWLGVRRGHGQVRRAVFCALQRYAWMSPPLDGKRDWRF